jgi:uncharacterized protein YyaL (SSP411 family)
MASQLLLRLHHFTGKDQYRASAEKVLRSYYDAMESQPFGFAHMLCALDSHEGVKEIVIVGNPAEAGVQELIAEINSIYLPNKGIQTVRPGASLVEISPLLQGKTAVDGKPTAYVCQNFTCSAPVTSAAELRALLEK